MAVREALVNAQGTELRMLAVVPSDRRAEIARQLAPLKPDLLFLEHLAEAEVAIREDDVFQVALFPASCSDTDWWELWGVLALLNPPLGAVVTVARFGGKCDESQRIHLQAFRR